MCPSDLALLVNGWQLSLCAMFPGDRTHKPSAPHISGSSRGGSKKAFRRGISARSLIIDWCKEQNALRAVGTHISFCIFSNKTKYWLLKCEVQPGHCMADLRLLLLLTRALLLNSASNEGVSREDFVKRSGMWLMGFFLNSARASA